MFVCVVFDSMILDHTNSFPGTHTDTSTLHAAGFRLGFFHLSLDYFMQELGDSFENKNVSRAFIAAVIFSLQPEL